MIYLVNGADAGRYSRWIDEMHLIRAKVFRDRLGWDVQVEDGREVDRFDGENPLYILSVDDRGRVEGSLRLLPTIGPNMLRDVFPSLLGPEETVESATIWESSRFSLDPDRPMEVTSRKLNRVTTELLCAIVEVGLAVGLSFVVSVFDARMVRIFRAAQCPADMIGAPQKIGKVMTYAGLFDISEEAWGAIASAGGISDRVISKDSDAPRKAA